jgi:hypothetical protein
MRRGYWQLFGLAGVANQNDRSHCGPIFPVSNVKLFDKDFLAGWVLFS